MNKQEKNWAVAMLFFGVLLGVTGNLAANSIDRIFQPTLGAYYNAVVVILFVGLLVLFERLFAELIEGKKNKS